MHDERQRRLPVTMMAEEGSLVQGDDGPLFIMERGNRQELDAKEPDNPSLSILHFERYTLDLAANASPPGERSPKPKEQYVHELLDPPQSLSEARRNGRIAEAHKRLTWPLNALVFALIGLAALLAREYDRRGPWQSLLIATVGVVLVQALNIAIGSLAEQHLGLIPLLYAATIAPGADRPRGARRPSPAPDPSRGRRSGMRAGCPTAPPRPARAAALPGRARSGCPRPCRATSAGASCSASASPCSGSRWSRSWSTSSSCCAAPTAGPGSPERGAADGGPPPAVPDPEADAVRRPVRDPVDLPAPDPHPRARGGARRGGLGLAVPVAGARGGARARRVHGPRVQSPGLGPGRPLRGARPQVPLADPRA